MSEPEQDALSRLDALEKRLTLLEDDKSIRELLSRYGYYADASLDDEYYALFTSDCVMDVSSGQLPDPYEVIRWEGLDAMKEFMRARTAIHGDGFAGHSLHMQGNNLSVDVRGDEATAAGYSFILQQEETSVRLVSASINEWSLRRIEGAWRIAQRTRRMVGAPDSAEVLRSTERTDR